MKTLLFVAVFLVWVAGVSQNSVIKPLLQQEGALIKATYYYEDGKIAQTGFYRDNKPHGVWKSYNPEGEQTATALYEEGAKTGKWFFREGNKLVEVDYSKNRIMRVTNWNNAQSVVLN